MLPTAVVIGDSVNNIETYKYLIDVSFEIVATFVFPASLQEIPASDYVILCSAKYFSDNTLGSLKGLISNDKIIRLYDATIEDNERLSALKIISIFFREPGNVAELGVKRGDFAKHINNAFPSSALYLFDTFEGLADIDIVAENELIQERSISQLNKAKIQQALTSEEFVLRQLSHPEKAIIKHGYFPKTTIGINSDIKFQFVSIDVDLYEPTLSGLNYFFSKLIDKGVIMVHDYSPHCGVYEAVNKFCSENSVQLIELNDNGHSVIIAKV